MGPFQNVTLITEDGQEYQLFRTELFNFVGINGIGIPNVVRKIHRTPKQDGVFDVGFSIDDRKMIMTLLINADSPAEADYARSILVSMIQPSFDPFQLKFVRDDGRVRQIDCFLNGAVDFPTSERMDGKYLATIPLYAPDPTFYDPTQNLGYMDMELGAGSLTLTYPNDAWMDYPIIYMTGPMTDLVIEYDPGNITLSVDGAIPAGETWIADFRPGFKNIYNQADNESRFPNLLNISTNAFSEFAIRNRKLLDNTITGTTSNSFAATATGTTAASEIFVYYYTRYLFL